MASKILLVITVVVVLHFSNGLDVSTFITKCKASNGECIRQNALANRELFGKGLPEYNIEPLDPAFFKSIDASKPNLRFILNDVTITGLSKCDIKKSERNLEKSTLSVDLICDIIADGDYTMNGHLLFLPIEGEGKLHAELKKLEITGEAIMETYTGKDGKDHWRITTWTHKFELHDKSKLHLRNLFNGNKALSKAVRDLLDNNPNEVVYDIGDPVVHAVIAKLAKAVTTFWKKVPVQDLALNN